MPTKTELTIAVPTPTASIFIYTPESAFSDAKPPPSPTSSLKACFVRSRPTSTDFEYEYSFNDFSGLGNGAASSISSGTTSPPSTTSESVSTCQDFMDQVTLATEQWARAQLVEKDEDRPLPSANSDARSVALSTLTASSRHTIVPVRIVRRSDAEADEELAKLVRETKILEVEKEGDKSNDAEKVKAKDDTKRRRTWPSYKAIRKTVSNIVHRKETPAPPPTPASTSTEKLALEPIVLQRERIKSSSASLFSRRRRRATISDDSDKASTRTTSRPSFLQRALSTSSRPTPNSTLQHRAQLRRSRSFSGFTTVLTAIVDAEQEQDENLDEVTAEARNVVEGIGKRWAFEEVMENVDDESAGFLFERCVE